MKALAIALTSLAVFATSPASAASGEEALAQCAWSKASMTSANLVKIVKFDKQYVYDADGSPTVGLLMRLWAACNDEKTALQKSSGRSIEQRKFLKALRAVKPAASPIDVFSAKVFRCETRFADEHASEEPAAVGWGFGDDSKLHQLSYTARLFGVTATAAEVSGAVDGNDNMIRALLLRGQAEGEKAASVDTRAEGVALKGPYAVKDGGGKRSCQLVNPDGSYSDA